MSSLSFYYHYYCFYHYFYYLNLINIIIIFNFIQSRTHRPTLRTLLEWHVMVEVLWFLLGVRPLSIRQVKHHLQRMYPSMPWMVREFVYVPPGWWELSLICFNHVIGWEALPTRCVTPAWHTKIVCDKTVIKTVMIDVMIIRMSKLDIYWKINKCTLMKKL